MVARPETPRHMGSWNAPGADTALWLPADIPAKNENCKVKRGPTGFSYLNRIPFGATSPFCGATTGFSRRSFCSSRRGFPC